jgi:hypothetical protein
MGVKGCGGVGVTIFFTLSPFHPFTLSSFSAPIADFGLFFNPPSAIRHPP